MNRLSLCSAILTLVLSAPCFSAGVPAAAADCDDCHGPGGVSPYSDIPSIGGQSQKYLIDSLGAFKQRERPCAKSEYRSGETSRPATTMCEIAAGLSREDVDQLADYYGEMEFVAAKQAFDPALAKTGADLHAQNCQSCHPKGGRIPARGPILAGQWMPYLRVAIGQSKGGEHLVPPYMERLLSDFSEAEIDALLNFYASEQD